MNCVSKNVRRGREIKIQPPPVYIQAILRREQFPAGLYISKKINKEVKKLRRK